MEQFVWKFYGFFNIDTDSKFLQFWFKVHVLAFQWSCIYIGCTMQSMAILNASGIKEIVETLFISIAYMNAAVKFFILYHKREQVQILWKTLDAPEFKIITGVENE